MKAELVFHTKHVNRDGSIIEMKIWRVEKTKDKPYGIKYSLVYIENGVRIIGYDNYEGKGDHKHYADKEEPYIFDGVDKLINDFLSDVNRFKRGEL